MEPHFLTSASAAELGHHAVAPQLDIHPRPKQQQQNKATTKEAEKSINSPCDKQKLINLLFCAEDIDIQDLSW